MRRNCNDNEGLIFLQECFTSTKSRLLKESIKVSRQHNYKYKGYTVIGEVRVKKMTIVTTLPQYAQNDLEKII